LVTRTSVAIRFGAITPAVLEGPLARDAKQFSWVVNSARVGGACRWRDGEQTEERDEAVPRREGRQHDASREHVAGLLIAGESVLL